MWLGYVTGLIEKGRHCFCHHFWAATGQAEYSGLIAMRAHTSYIPYTSFARFSTIKNHVGRIFSTFTLLRPIHTIIVLILAGSNFLRRHTVKQSCIIAVTNR